MDRLQLIEKIRSRTRAKKQTPTWNGPKRRLVLNCHQAPGDTCVSTGVLWSLHETYPDQYETKITGCAAAELFANHPYAADFSEQAQQVNFEHPAFNDDRSTNVRWSMMQAQCFELGKFLGVPLEPRTNKPMFFLTPSEKRYRLLKESYCLINAGWKDDFETKWYSRWQEVVDGIRAAMPWLTVVQIGELGQSHYSHHHPPLNGTLNLLGKTNARQLLLAASGSLFGLGPLSFLMHLYAGLEKPYICAASAFEPPTWTPYANVVRIGRSGELKCCANGACCRSKWHDCAENMKDIFVPGCLDIPPREFVEAAVRLQDNGRLIEPITRCPFLGDEIRETNGSAEPCGPCHHNTGLSVRLKVFQCHNAEIGGKVTAKECDLCPYQVKQ
jgi:ADP-heptose:LPS heptosyltransferase